MFILLKTQKSPGDIITHQDIFPRPTPWKIYWHAWLNFLVNHQNYQFVFIPQEYSNLDAYDLLYEDGTLSIVQENSEALHTAPIYKMGWSLWWVYVFESWAFGLFLSFWNWRWESGKLTKRELQAKLERLQRRSEERTRRIVMEDDED